MAIFGNWIQESISQQSLAKDYLTLAVSILQNRKSLDDDSLLRDWAADLLNAKSPIPVSPALIANFKSGKAVIPITPPTGGAICPANPELMREFLPQNTQPPFTTYGTDFLYQKQSDPGSKPQP